MFRIGHLQVFESTFGTCHPEIWYKILYLEVIIAHHPAYGKVPIALRFLQTDRPWMRQMSKRTYGQFCPIAYSLDLIGDRWTLLVLRELMFGPRRFTDLYAALPGIGKNLLSRRLKQLEQEAVIRRRKLPPPAPAAVYELAERGLPLRHILADLSRWGLPLMWSGSLEQHHLGVVALMNAFGALFQFNDSKAVEAIGEFHIGEEIFQVRVHMGDIGISPGQPEMPSFVVEGAAKLVLSLLVGSGPTPAEALSASRFNFLKGGLSELEDFLNAFSLPDVV